MENSAPWESCNLHKKRLLKNFLTRNPTDKEIALRECLSGHTPQQAAEVIAEDFRSQFDCLNTVGVDIKAALIKNDKYFGWVELDRRVQHAHRRLICWREYAAAAYLDRLRNILFSLPNRERYEDLPESKKIYRTPKEAVWGFGTCYLCWRSVPNKREKSLQTYFSKRS